MDTSAPVDAAGLELAAGRSPPRRRGRPGRVLTGGRRCRRPGGASAAPRARGGSPPYRPPQGRPAPRSTVQVLKAVDKPAVQPAAVPDQLAAAAAPPSIPTRLAAAAAGGYPGDAPSPGSYAAWMAAAAQKAGLPPQFPIMAALTQSGLHNLGGGDRDSMAFFQMRTSVWWTREYAGYGQNPELQLKWFIAQASRSRSSDSREARPAL